MDWSSTLMLVFLGLVTCAMFYSMSAVKLENRVRRVEQDVRLIMNHLGIESTAEQALGTRRHEIDALLREGKKIAAIKLYRELTGVGLKEAKDAIDQMSAGR